MQMSQFVTPSGPRLPGGILLEGIVTTLDADGAPHIAPMGPIVDVGFTQLLLRPYRTSTTYQNLKRTGQGVLHVTDDVEMFARSAVGQLTQVPKMIAATAVEGLIIADTCRWYAFRVESIDDRQERTEIAARVVEQGRFRDFFGFNRAKHAVIEAAIFATRVQFVGTAAVQSEFDRLSVIVEKTGSHQERSAFAFLQTFVSKLSSPIYPAETAQG
jgi:uncharacterized protein